MHISYNLSTVDIGQHDGYEGASTFNHAYMVIFPLFQQISEGFIKRQKLRHEILMIRYEGFIIWSNQPADDPITVSNNCKFDLYNQ